MPSGYTADIEEGIEFKDFAMNCARNFGALIHMRDEPSSTPIPKVIEPSDYHLKEMVKDRERLQALESFTDHQKDKKAKDEYKKTVAEYKGYDDKKIELAKKYDEMLDKVRKWKPPTADHQGLYKFMVQQITDSKEWDCKIHEREFELLSGEEWFKQQQEQLLNKVKYHEGQYAKEVERCAERSKWLQDLIKSLQ